MKMFDRLEVYLDGTPRSAALNMAIDEALLEHVAAPSIRFYRWTSAALSFGYFGRFADVTSYARKRDLVRRWTGGGIVFHGDDLTYSIVIPAGDPVFGESSMSIYEKIHCALRNALAANGGGVELAAMGRDAALRRPRTAQRAVPTNMCFANAVRADVMIDGRKIAGAAQRRTRAGLLQQGSIQGVDLGNGLAERFAKELSHNRETRSLRDTVQNRAEEIAARKYATEDWLRKR
jgi:lipoate-protein ligase A